jgi:hypothetical protein
VLFCLWFSIRTLRLPSVTVGDTLAVVGDRGGTLAVEGTQVDIMVVVGTLAVEGTQVDIMVVVDTQAVITTVTVRGIIPVGTAGGVTGIIPVDIGGALGAMLIQVGGGLIRPSIYIPITILMPTPIPIPILIPMIFLQGRAP